MRTSWFRNPERRCPGNDELIGKTGSDDLFGQAGRDRLSGGAQHDSLYGGANDDRLFGGTGYDSMFGQWASDTVVSRDSQWDYLRGGVGKNDKCYEDSVARGDGFSDSAAGFSTILTKRPK